MSIPMTTTLARAVLHEVRASIESKRASVQTARAALDSAMSAMERTEATATEADEVRECYRLWMSAVEAHREAVATVTSDVETQVDEILRREGNAS